MSVKAVHVQRPAADNPGERHGSTNIFASTALRVSLETLDSYLLNMLGTAQLMVLSLSASDSFSFVLDPSADSLGAALSYSSPVSLRRCPPPARENPISSRRWSFGPLCPSRCVH